MPPDPQTTNTNEPKKSPKFWLGLILGRLTLLAAAAAMLSQLAYCAIQPWVKP